MISYSDEVLRLSQANLLRDQLGLQERYKDQTPIIIDIDIPNAEVADGISNEFKKSIVSAFCYAIKTCLIIEPDDERLLLAYVLEKEQTEKQKKTGIHLQFPFVVVSQDALKVINNFAIARLKEQNVGGSFTTPIEKMVDVMFHKNWNLYGSTSDVSKRPYLLSKIYNGINHTHLEEVTLEESLCIAFQTNTARDALRHICFRDEYIPDSVPNWDTKPIEWYLPYLFSLNTYYKESLNRTQKAFVTFRVVPKIQNKILRQEEERKEKESKRKELLRRSVEDDEIPPPVEVDTLKSLISLIGSNSVSDRDDWFAIGSALYTCTNASEEGLELFKEVSQKTDRGNYCEHACTRLWNTEYELGHCSVGKLMHYAMKDSPEEYAKKDFSKLRTEAFKSKLELLTKKRTNDLTPEEARRLCAFLPADITFSSPKITEQMYLDWFGQSKVVCLQSPMSSGKTYNLPVLFKQFKRILFIGNRRSLEQSYLNDFGVYGFILYSMIEEGMITEDRVIVQIDSLHRVAGEFDLIICDEIELTVEHLMGFVKDRKEAFNRLFNYIQHTPRVLFCDALLCKETINIFLKNKNPLIVQNTVTPYSHNQIYFLDSREETLFKIIEESSKGKKVVVPTNSVRFADDLELGLQKAKSSLRIAKITGKIPINERIPPSEWNQYDVLIYTSAISAGISFNLEHFDSRICYFRNDSACAKICVQMITRVRQTREDIIYICCDCKVYQFRPVSRPAVEKYINDFVRLKYSVAQLAGERDLNEHTVNLREFDIIDGLVCEYPHFSFTKDDYYYLKVYYLQQYNRSMQYFKEVLSQCLILHGMTIAEKSNPVPVVVENKDQIVEEIVSKRKQIKEAEYQEIAVAPVLGEKEYETLIRKPDKSKQEEHQILKFSLVQTYQPQSEITPVFVKELLPKKQAYRNLRMLRDYRKYEDIQAFLVEQHRKSYSDAFVHKRLKPTRNENPFFESSSDSENTDQSGYVTETSRITLIDNSSSYNLIETNHLWIKCFYAIKLLSITGLPELWNEETFQLKFKEVCEFFQQNEVHLYILFNTKKKDWKKILEDIAKEMAIENDKIRLKNEENEQKNKTARGRKRMILPLKEIWEDADLQKGIIQMVNHILGSIFGLKIESIDINKNGNKNRDYKCYSPLFKKWNLKTQPQTHMKLLRCNPGELRTVREKNGISINLGERTVLNSEHHEEEEPSMKSLSPCEDEETALLREMAASEKEEKDRQRKIRLEYENNLKFKEANQEWLLEQKRKVKERYQQKKASKTVVA